MLAATRALSIVFASELTGEEMSTFYDPALDPANQSAGNAISGGENSVYAQSAEDVVGPGVTAQELKIHAAPKETKRASDKGKKLMWFSGFVIISGLAIGIAMSGQKGDAQSADAAKSGSANSNSKSTTVVATAPRVQDLSKSSPDTALSDAAGVPRPVDAPGDASAPGASSASAQNRPPTPREQYLEWLEKHRYDRLRAKLVADQSAYTAKLVDDAAGASMRGAVARAGVNPAGVGAGSGGGGEAVAYTGQPRPERLDAVNAALASAAAAANRGPGVPAAAAVPPVPFAAARTGAPGAADDPVARAERAERFLESERDAGYLDSRVAEKRAGNEIAAGTTIPAVMLTAINSDLPGSIVAQVRSDVFDTFDYRVKLIPAGSRLVGRYSSEIIYGQERVLAVWDELIFPNGRRINLKGMQATDAVGAAGMSDEVHTHFWRTWGNALLVSMIGALAQQAQPQNSSGFSAPTASQQATQAAANSLNETAQAVLRKNLNIAPTLEIRPGYLFNVLVNRSVSLPAYRD